MALTAPTGGRWHVPCFSVRPRIALKEDALAAAESDHGLSHVDKASAEDVSGQTESSAI